MVMGVLLSALPITHTVPERAGKSGGGVKGGDDRERGWDLGCNICAGSAGTVHAIRFFESIAACPRLSPIVSESKWVMHEASSP